MGKNTSTYAEIDANGLHLGETQHSTAAQNYPLVCVCNTAHYTCIRYISLLLYIDIIYLYINI